MVEWKGTRAAIVSICGSLVRTLSVTGASALWGISGNYQLLFITEMILYKLTFDKHYNKIALTLLVPSFSGSQFY